MKAQGALLVALALLVAGAAAGPIRPVAEPTQKGDTQYVFVKLLFEGAFAQLLAPGLVKQGGSVGGQRHNS